MNRKPRKTPNTTQLDIKKGFTRDEIIAALSRNGGRVYPAAKDLGVFASTIYDRIKRDPTIGEHAKEVRAELLEAVENKFLEKVDEGDTTVLIFLAKTLGKERGYTERTELSGKEGGAIEIVIRRGGDNG